MHWWVNTNLEAYKNLCKAEIIVSVIIEQKECKSLVDMTVQMDSA